MAIFNPSRDEVRDFFIQTWKKRQENKILSPIESIALGWMEKHPEYHNLLEQEDSKSYDFSVNQGQTNPFLHLSMHLAIDEQISIDSPPGIRKAFQQLSAKTNEHDAIHEIMDCLGQVIWEAQRNRSELNHERYLELIKQKSTRHTLN